MWNGRELDIGGFGVFDILDFCLDPIISFCSTCFRQWYRIPVLLCILECWESNYTMLMDWESVILNFVCIFFGFKFLPRVLYVIVNVRNRVTWIVFYRCSFLVSSFDRLGSATLFSSLNIPSYMMSFLFAYIDLLNSELDLANQKMIYLLIVCNSCINKSDLPTQNDC